MIYLFLSILSSSIIYVIFKWVGIKQVSTLKVILVNYLVASSFGFLYAKNSMPVAEMIASDWFLSTLLLGSSFVFIFHLMAVTTQKLGTSTAVVATKMSLIIPVIFAYFFLGEEMPALKILGIIAALVGVYLTVKKKDQRLIDLSSLLPLLVFLLSGMVDLSLKFIQHSYLNDEATEVFVPTLFSFAFISGLIYVTVKEGSNALAWNVQSILAGAILGVVNYFSIYFLVRALEIETLDSSFIFPVNNISIVLLASFFGILIFKERLQFVNQLGIVVSIVAILLIWLS